MDQRPSLVVLQAHVAVTLFMTGLIWFVQIVHYPLFAMVKGQFFSLYHTTHTQLTTWVVGVPMLAEAATALFLIARRPPGVSFVLPALGLIALATIWASTWLLQVPQHDLLSAGFDGEAHSFLVDSNWIRTCGWTFRSFLVLALMATVMGRIDHPVTTDLKEE